MKYDLELPWIEFKDQVLDSNLFQALFFDTNNEYKIFAKQNDFTVICRIYKDSGSDQSDFENNYKDSINNQIKNNVQTQFERDDILLQICRAESQFDQNCNAEISILVPGNIGQDVRYVAGGYAFTDDFEFGDSCTKIQVVDNDNILGYGAHTVIRTYHDADVDEQNQGWYLYTSPQKGGEIEIDPLGFYGSIPSGLYLEIYFKKVQSSQSSKVFANIWWGK